MLGRQQLSGKPEEIPFTARGKGQLALFGAAVCHPEQFFSLFLFCHRTDALYSHSFLSSMMHFVFVWQHIPLNPVSCPPFIHLHLFLSPHSNLVSVG
jgi:hypothetical protein